MPAPAASHQLAPPGPPHPHVAAVERVRSALLFALGTPIAIGMLVALLLPLCFGSARVQGVLAHARDAALAEVARAGALAAPSWAENRAAGRAERVAAAVAVAVDAALGPGEPPTAARSASGNPAAEPDSALGRVLARSRTRVAPLLGPWLATAAVRGLLLAELAALAAPMLAVAAMLGAAHARARQERGDPSRPRARARWAFSARLSAATFGAVCALPWPLPSLPLLAALVLALGCSIHGLARHDGAA